MKRSQLSVRNNTIITLVLSVIIGHCSLLNAQDAGSRASFTRGGWAGARYAAMGKAAEVIVNDVFSIYWNPAGLGELKSKEKISTETITKKAEKGDIDSISKDDLVRFSEDSDKEIAFQIGVSAAMLDLERQAGFGGIAFSLFSGVFGMGLYYIQSPNIESYKDDGTYNSKFNYSASVAFLSYGWTIGVSSFGISLKGLQEKIGEYEYYGGGCDIGSQVEVIPFLKIGFVIQDIGSGLKPKKSYASLKNEYDVASPSMKLSAALTSRASDFILAISAVKKLEQERYEFNIGIQYDVSRFLSICGGLNDSKFSSGFIIKARGLEISYAFLFDKINSGYNNILSVTMGL